MLIFSVPKYCSLCKQRRCIDRYTAKGTDLMGGEIDLSPYAVNQSDDVSTHPVTGDNIYFNAATSPPTASGGSNFFQPRELGTALGFEVDFDAAFNTAIVRSAQ